MQNFHMLVTYWVVVDVVGEKSHSQTIFRYPQNEKSGRARLVGEVVVEHWALKKYTVVLEIIARATNKCEKCELLH